MPYGTRSVQPFGWISRFEPSQVEGTVSLTQQDLFRTSLSVRAQVNGEFVLIARRSVNRPSKHPVLRATARIGHDRQKVFEIVRGVRRPSDPREIGLKALFPAISVSAAHRRHPPSSASADRSGAARAVAALRRTSRAQFAFRT
jgi:hypothetical protein